MALNPAEKNKVVQLLGYGGKILQPGSVIYNKILNDRLDSLPPEVEDLTRTYLNQVATLEGQLFAAPTRLIAQQVGDIKLNNDEMQGLRSERKKLAREMAAHLDIPYVGKNGPNIGRRV